MELLQVFTGLRRMATTNGAGIYRFEAVDLGAHEPKIAHAGFKSFEASGLSVEANRTAVVDIELELGSEAVTIQVGAASGMIAKDGPLRGGNFSATQVSQLPLTGLNPFSLARTLPGVIIGLGREHSYERRERVIERALALGCSDVEAISVSAVGEPLATKATGASRHRGAGWL